VIQWSDADVDDTATDGGEFKASNHGTGMAGGIDNDIGEGSVGDGFNLGEVGAIGLGLHGVLDAEFVFAEVETVLREVDDDDGEVHELEELKGGEADGARADDHGGIPGLGIATLHSVVADGEGLDEGQFVVGEVIAGMKFVGWDEPI